MPVNHAIQHDPQHSEGRVIPNMINTEQHALATETSGLEWDIKGRGNEERWKKDMGVVPGVKYQWTIHKECLRITPRIRHWG
jgi:hypothetical protein